jgi:hypothetical protein
MERFVQYINSVLPDREGNELLYRFKKKTLDEMNARAVEVTGRGGILSRKVVEDLIISEHADLVSEYSAFETQETAKIKARRSFLGNIIGSAVFIILLITVFIAVSMATDLWKYTWIIVVDGILLWVVYLLGLGIKKLVSMKRIFHFLARLLLFGAVVVTMVAVFLAFVALTDLPHSWLLVIIGLILAFVCDGIFAEITKARLRIIYWLIYIPVISVFLFIILGALNILAWNVAWMIIPLSLVVDLIIIYAAIRRNRADRMEVADVWNEN